MGEEGWGCGVIRGVQGTLNLTQSTLFPLELIFVSLNNLPALFLTHLFSLLDKMAV